MSKTTIDDLTDQLLSNVFRNIVDVTDFRNCRLVSKKWKRTVMSASRDQCHLVYPLTDSTLHTVHGLKEALVSFDVYSFTGEENKEVWSTSGIKLLMQTTDWLQFSGNEVSTSELRKIIGLAIDSLKTLSLKSLKKNLALPLLQMHTPFRSLRKLAMGYYIIDENEDKAFDTFTSTLEKWISLDCRIQLPLLESLNLYFDGRGGSYLGYWHRHMQIVQTEALFRNYLAIGRLLLKYKNTLKEIQIERFFCRAMTYQPHMYKPQWTEMERGLETLDELSLNRLKVSTNMYTYYGNSPIEIEVLGRPSNLKNVLFQNLLYPYRDAWGPLIATLSSVNNVNSRYLKSLKINMNLFPTHDPTLAINLGGLRECINLKTLWLMNSKYRLGGLLVKNMELLPRGISILRFQSTEQIQHRYSMGDEILLNEQQIRWIVVNLQGLESFWMSLLIPEPTNDDENNAVVQVAAEADDNEEDDEDGGVQPQQQVDANMLVNINLNTFRDLRALPLLKDLRLDMMKATALASYIRLRQGLPIQNRGLGTSLNDIIEYQNLFDPAEYKTTITTRNQGFGVNNISGYATLTIQKK